MQGKIKYTFSLNATESVVFIVEENNMQNVCYDSFATNYFIERTKKTTLTHDTLYHSCQCLSILLQKALKKKLFFDENKTADIGFLTNEINYRERELKEENVNDSTSNHALWSPVIKRGNTETWIYNNAKGDIILFMGPIYPFFFCARRGKNYMPYPQWIKTYEPFKKFIIPKKVAQQWLKQANEIMELIEINSAKDEHGLECLRPKNGQQALDNSVAFKESSSARVSVSDKEFVIFTKTKEKIFHGHVIPWDGLELAMQDALQDAGLVTFTGKIICKN